MKFYSCLGIQLIFLYLLSYELKMFKILFVQGIQFSYFNSLRTIGKIFNKKLQFFWRICFNILTEKY